MAEAEAAVVLDLAEAVLPGGAGFPGFAATGAGAVLLRRLGAAERGRLAGVVGAGAEAVARLEASEPALFAAFRKAVYLAYYEQPAVIAAIRALGHPYNDAPLPDGYPAEAFDPARDAPRHGRGLWIDTEDVRRVDVSALNLGCVR